MSPQTSGRSTRKRLRKYGESSAGQRSTSSPQKTTLIAKLIFRRTGMRWPTTGPTSSFMLFPGRPDPTVNPANQGTEAQNYVSGPALEEPALVCGAGVATHCRPVAHSPETRPPLSGKQNDLALNYGCYIFGLSIGGFGTSRECAKYYFSG